MQNYLKKTRKTRSNISHLPVLQITAIAPSLIASAILRTVILLQRKQEMQKTMNHPMIV